MRYKIAHEFSFFSSMIYDLSRVNEDVWLWVNETFDMTFKCVTLEPSRETCPESYLEPTAESGVRLHNRFHVLVT